MFNRVLAPRAETPRNVSRFFWTAIGPEIQLDIGQTDLYEVREAIERAKRDGAEQAPVSVYISDRLLLNPDVAKGLLDAMEAAVKYLREYGLLSKESDATG